MNPNLLAIKYLLCLARPMALVPSRSFASNEISPNSKLTRLQSLLLVLAFATVAAVPAVAQSSPTLTGGQFTANCGNATAAPIFDAALIGSGVYGVNNLIAVSDPDIVLIGNQWWMIFATGPVPPRAIQPFAAYLPPGASLSTSTTYPSDPNGWRLVGAQANGQGAAVPVSPNPGANGWDELAAETPSVNVNPDGTVSVYYSGHNAGQTPFQIGLMTDFSNGSAYGDPNPVATAEEPWEFSSGLPALLEQSVRWEPQLNKFVMLYTAGAWWASPPDNTIAYADSTDGVNWVNRQELGFPVSYYNQDFLYNPIYDRYEMVVSNDPTGAGGANPRNIVWRDAATPNAAFSNWQNEVTLLQYDAPNAAGWYNSGTLSPAVKYGNLPGEENRIYVFFHSYSQSGDMVIGRFYCDANQTFYLTPSPSAVTLAQGASTTANITVTPQSGFTGAVNFSVSGFPSGVTGSFAPASSTTGTTLPIGVAAGVLPGQYPITVTGASGGMSETTSFTLTVTGTTPAQQPQTITFNTIPTQSIDTLNVASYASASSGLPVTFSLVPTGNCVITGTNVAFIDYGACGIVASQAGNATYAAAPEVGQVVNVSNTPTAQTISFGPIPAQTVGTPLALTAIASSGLPVSFTSTATSVCTVAGATAAFIASGTCTIDANQSGNGVYSAAPQVPQSFTVNPAPAFVVSGGSSSLTLEPGAATGNTVSIAVTPSNGFTGTVSLACSIAPVAASDPPACTLTPSSVTITGAAAQGSTLTIYTTAATSSRNELMKLFWPSAGATMALLIFGIPHRRKSLAMLGTLALAVLLGLTCFTGCGGSNNGSGGGGNPGTTAGAYTVTITGTSGNITGAVGSVALTVQ
ncbi:MAG: hypothetical protein ABR956_06265 [Terracidiphilus sp.]|jgi:hypothetical protein